jgi:hypothetical protein
MIQTKDTVDRCFSIIKLRICLVKKHQLVRASIPILCAAADGVTKLAFELYSLLLRRLPMNHFQQNFRHRLQSLAQNKAITYKDLGYAQAIVSLQQATEPPLRNIE